MSKSFKIKVPVPKIRKPVAKKPNTVMKSKKDYRRKPKHGKLWKSVPQE
jgi:hypothetical protein